MRSIRTLSMIVAGHLIDVLVNRADVPHGVADEIRGLVAARLDPPAPPGAADFLEGARQKHEAGKLNEGAFLDACASGDTQQAAAILSVSSGVSLETIERAVTLRSPKALVSVVGRAGFTMRAGCVVQSLLGRLGPNEILTPTADGAFPLSPDEMDWQIELLGQPGR